MKPIKDPTRPGPCKKGPAFSWADPKERHQNKTNPNCPRRWRSGSGTMTCTNEETFPLEEEHQGTEKGMDEGEDGEDVLRKRPRIEDEYDELEDLAEFRRFWVSTVSHYFGPLDATTGSNIGPMRYTDSGPPRYGGVPYDAVEIISLKVTELKEGLQWPIRVFGLVAVRDSLDHKRNVLFERAKENCQTLTAEDSYLTLTGPSRAIALIDPLEFEVELRVLGCNPLEETVLSAIYYEYNNSSYNYSNAGLVRTCRKSSKRSTIELKYSQLHVPLEATIEVCHKEGLQDFHGRFYAHMEYMADDDIVLLDSRDLKVNLTPDGRILLSRNVVLVEEGAKLTLGLKAWQNEDAHSAVDVKYEFPSKLNSRSDGFFDVGFSKMSITVAWSVLC